MVILIFLFQHRNLQYYHTLFFFHSDRHNADCRKRWWVFCKPHCLVSKTLLMISVFTGMLDILHHSFIVVMLQVCIFLLYNTVINTLHALIFRELCKNLVGKSRDPFHTNIKWQYASKILLKLTAVLICSLGVFKKRKLSCAYNYGLLLMELGSTVESRMTDVS